MQAYENGDMETAEERREWLTLRNIAKKKLLGKEKAVPNYFDEWVNPVDKGAMYKYNGRYFEHDRPNKAWSHLPDLHSGDCTPDLYMLIKEKDRPRYKLI